MKKRIICMILSLVAVFSFFGFESTQAWFAAGEDKQQILAAGDLKFEVIGELNQSTTEGEVQKVLPGDKVTPEGGIKITNKSNIDSNLRVKVAFTYSDENGVHEEFFTGATTDYIKVEFANENNNWASKGNYYYYYSDPANDDMRIPAVTGAEGENNEIPFITAIEFNGEKITEDFQGTVASVTVMLESKQADYVTWENLGSIGTIEL